MAEETHQNLPEKKELVNVEKWQSLSAGLKKRPQITDKEATQRFECYGPDDCSCVKIDETRR